LGAFGSTASVTIPGQSIAFLGVAAIAVGLFLVLQHLMNDRYVRVTVGGDIGDAQVELVGDRSYLGAFQRSERFYDFIIFGSEIRHRVLALYVTTADRREYIFECISRDAVTPYLTSGDTVSWQFNKARGALVKASDGSLIADLGRCGQRPLAAHEPSAVKLVLSVLTGWISPAHSQVKSATQALETQRNIEKLESSTSHVRRDARSSLAVQGTVAVEPLLSRLAEPTAGYQIRLGVVVALAEMMRENRSKRNEIAGKLTDADLVRLVDAAIDEDRTIRVYASEFLYNLGDPRILASVRAKYPDANEDGRYNLMLVLKGSVSHMTDAQRKEVVLFAGSVLSASTPKTNQLANIVVEQATKIPVNAAAY
jgi:hypothetical protein